MYIYIGASVPSQCLILLLKDGLTWRIEITIITFTDLHSVYNPGSFWTNLCVTSTWRRSYEACKLLNFLPTQIPVCGGELRKWEPHNAVHFVGCKTLWWLYGIYMQHSFHTITEESIQVNMASCSMLNWFYCFRRLRSGDDPTIPAPWSGEKTGHANYGPQETHSGPHLTHFQPDIT
jgi:hypothetical protein